MDHHRLHRRCCGYPGIGQLERIGLSPEVWAVLAVLVALLIAILVAYTRKDVAYELVIVWAFLGIVVNQGAHEAIQALLLSSIVVIIIALAASILYFGKMPRRVSPS